MMVYSDWGRGGKIHSYNPLIGCKQQQISLLAPMLEQHFTSFQPHVEGSHLILSTNSQQISTLGSDDIIFTIDEGLQHTQSLILNNQEQRVITAFAIHPCLSNHYVVGTQDGTVKYLKPINKMNLSMAELVFKGDKPINHLIFSSTGNYLSISSEESSAVIYCTKSKRLLRLPSEHEGIVNRTLFCRDKYLASLGSQGSLFLHSITSNQSSIKPHQSQSEDPFEQLNQDTQLKYVDKYKIANESITKRYFVNATFGTLYQHGVPTDTILVGGQTFLQKVEVSIYETNYRVGKQIRQEHEILQVAILEAGQKERVASIVTVTDEFMSIWNYYRHEKILKMNLKEQLKSLSTFIQPVSFTEIPSFAFIVNHKQSNGKVYIFKHFSLLDISKSANPLFEQAQIQQEKKQVQQKYQKNENRSFSNQLILLYPQFPLDKGYQEYLGAKFLFYNNVGCVIERKDEDGNYNMRIQLHDKSKPNRFRIDKNRSFGLFALKETIFLTATNNHLVFQDHMLLNHQQEAWEVTWEHIQGIAIGNQWVAASNPHQIRVFDYCGNQLHCISFDRKFVTMEAYEDLLVVVYHASLPVWGCQALKMRIYRITTACVTIDRDVPVTLQPNSILKWFGFSQEGIIYCQDSLQYVRSYSFNRNQWTTIFTLEGKPERLYIQHIQSTNIYAFKLEHRQGQREEPKVLPRSLPRRVAMQWSELIIDFLSKDERSYLRTTMLKNYMLEHEHYRREMWYKYKYSRGVKHPWYEQSQSILSEEDYKNSQMLIDTQLYEYLKKYLDRADLTVQEYAKVASSLLLICQRQANYQETKDKLRSLLTKHNTVLLPNYINDILIVPREHSSDPISKLNEISILQKMISLMQ